MIEFCILISAVCHFVGFLILETRIREIQERLVSVGKSKWHIESVSGNNDTTYTVHYFKPDDDASGAVTK